MIRAAAVIGATALIAVALVSQARALPAITVGIDADSSGNAAMAGHGSTLGVVDYVAVDTDITGNSSPTPGTNNPANPINGGVDVPGGTVQNCIENLSIGQQVTIDVVVDEVDIADRMDSFQYQLFFNPAVVNGVLSGSSPNYFQMLAANTGSFPGNFALPVNNTTGVWGMVVTEQVVEPGEFGNGILARHTFTAFGAGVSQLTLADVLVVRPNNVPIPVTTVLNATIAVGTTCVPA